MKELWEIWDARSRAAYIDWLQSNQQTWRAVQYYGVDSGYFTLFFSCTSVNTMWSVYWFGAKALIHSRPIYGYAVGLLVTLTAVDCG